MIVTRNSLVAAAALTLLAAGCNRGGADKGQPSEQQRADLDNMAARMDNTQTVVLDDDSLTVNDSEANAALSRAPGNVAAPPAPATPAANSANQAVPR